MGGESPSPRATSRKTLWTPSAGLSPFTATPERSGGPQTPAESVNGKRGAEQPRQSAPCSPARRPLPHRGARATPSGRGRGGGPAGACAGGRESGWRLALFIYSGAPGQRGRVGPHPHPASAPPSPLPGLAGAGVGAVSAGAALPKVRLLTSERPLLSMNGSGSPATVWQRGCRRHRLLLDAGGVRAAAPA